MSQVFVVPGLTRRVEDRQHMRRAVGRGLPRIILGLLLLAPVLGFWLRTEIRHRAEESVPIAVELNSAADVRGTQPHAAVLRRYAATPRRIRSSRSGVMGRERR